MEDSSYPSDSDNSSGERIERWGKQWVMHAGHTAVRTPHASSILRRQTIRSKGMEMIEIDGSQGEGGGQILRTALTMSMIAGRPFSMKHIRANRTKPGLRPQHLAAIQAAASLCSAEVTGASVGSGEITFRPGPVKPRDMTLDIGTAGATSLVLQTVYLPLVWFADKPVRLVLEGGTFNTLAPSYPFLSTTWLHHMRALGMKVSLTMPHAGFYPIGGGRMEAWIEPGIPKPMIADRRGELVRVKAEAFICGLTRSIAERMTARAKSHLAERGIELEPNIVEGKAKGAGAAITLTAEHANAVASFVGLGERGKPAETVADEAVAELLAYLDVENAVVDAYSADQLLLPLALIEGKSIYTTTHITEHLRTNVATIQRFVARPIVLEDATPERPARVVVG